MNGGSAAVAAEASPRSRLIRRPPVPPMSSSVPPGRILPAALRATSSPSTTWSLSASRTSIGVHLEQRHVAAGRRPVTSTWSIGSGRSSKNRFSAAASVASKAAVLRAPTSRAACSSRSGLRPVRTTSAPSARARRAVSRPMPGAAADQDDGLSEQFRLALRS